MRMKNKSNTELVFDVPTLIKPSLSKFESGSLILLIGDYINSRDTIAVYFRKISSSVEYRNRRTPTKVSLTKFHKEIKRCWEIFPKALVNDIYNLYFYSTKDLYIEEESINYLKQYRLLIKSNIPSLKILTHGSFLKSGIVVRSLILHILIQFAKLNLLQLDEDKFIRATLNNNDAVDQDSWEEQFKSLFDNNISKDMLHSIEMQVRKECQQVDELMDQSMVHDLITNIATPSIGRQNGSQLNRFLMKLAQIDIASSALSEWVQKLLEHSTNYFQQKDNQEFELLIETATPQLPTELHLFHQQIRKIYLEELVVKKNESKCSIDLYIDISGSMDVTIINNKDGYKITSLDFAKAIAVEMVTSKLIDKLYLFNDKIYESDTSEENLANIKAYGGTNINIVLSQVVAQEKNAIIITDGMDRGGLYSSHAYLIGVKGANFKYFDRDVISQYSESEQVILFDGKEVYNIGRRGEIVSQADVL